MVLCAGSPVASAGPSVCEAGPDYDRSGCFVGDVPACEPCRDGWHFAEEMLTTGYTLSAGGARNYHHPWSTVLVASGRIAGVSGLPAGVLTHGVEVLVEFDVERAFVHPGPSAPETIRIAMDSELFSWGNSGVSRYALRHTVLPYLFHRHREIGAGILELKKQSERAVDWQSAHTPPQVYSGDEYGGDVPPGDSVLATSLPRLRAIEASLGSFLPDGLDASLSSDGTAFRQPADVNGRISTGVWIRRPRGGGFHDRSGVLGMGDRLLIVFRKRDRDGQAYRIRQDPTWQLFWGAEMDAVAAALDRLTACAAERTGRTVLSTDGEDRGTLDLTFIDCAVEYRERAESLQFDMP